MQLRSAPAINGRANSCYQDKGAVGMEFDIKAEFMHACREIR